MMKKLYIKDDVLHIDDGQHYYVIELDAIDLVTTDCCNISIKLYNGKQAILHLKADGNLEEFDALTMMLVHRLNFYQSSGCVVVNLENLQDASMEDVPNEEGYYGLKFKFRERQTRIFSKNLEGQLETKDDILEAKQCYDKTMKSTQVD